MTATLSSKPTLVINFCGAPGAGKSTAAAELFSLMKRDYLSCELVTEFAKDLIYSGNEHRLSDQAFVFAEQHHRIARLIGKVDFVISDSPLFLQAYYAPKEYPAEFASFALAMFRRYPSINIFLNRAHRYDPEGRIHSEAQSDLISGELRAFMAKNQIAAFDTTASEQTARQVLRQIIYPAIQSQKGNQEFSAEKIAEELHDTPLASRPNQPRAKL